MQDRDGGILFLTGLGDRFPLRMKLVADAAYRGPQFRRALATVPRIRLMLRKLCHPS